MAPPPVFQLDLTPGGPFLLRRRQVLGAVRSRDLPLSAEQHARLFCGWAPPELLWPEDLLAQGRHTVFVSGPHRIWCEDHPSTASSLFAGLADERLDSAGSRRDTAGTIDALLRDLRARAAAGGATAVDTVRCYVSDDIPRVWCEGVAVIGERDVSVPPLVASGATPPRRVERAVRLAWTRAPGAESCPDRDAIERDVALRLGRNPFDADGTRSLSVVCARQDAGWTARIVARDDAGEVQGTRTLRVDGPACAPIGAAVALSIVVELDE